MLVNVFKDHYCWPPGFYVDERYDADEPFQPDATLSTFNAELKATELINYIQDQAAHRRENHLLLPWGCDFTYANAKMNFDQMDKIIQFVNKYNTKNITLQYSTPSQYVDAVKKEQVKWAVKYDDGFPYSDNLDDYWTGYFTSRPTQKKMIRDASSYLHASEKMYAKKVIDKDVTEKEVKDIMQAKDALTDILGVLQHHDAVTGTEK